MPSKIQKWGNSMGVRIPKIILEKAGLAENSEVSVSEKNGVIMISSAELSYSLEKLVSQISKSNLQSEESFIAEGKEVW